jgi:hypothetical protein
VKPVAAPETAAPAIENSLDIELQRSALPAADTELPRAEGGGTLRGLDYTLAEAPAAVMRNNGLAGKANPFALPNPGFAGGYGTVLDQVLARKLQEESLEAEQATGTILDDHQISLDAAVKIAGVTIAIPAITGWP